ncbi:MAG: carboxypeptidase regulatory-like domain-containing protein [Gemmatirosa sp.]|nr:carboxypeptidase regulatory-like domain-containing protein [Gemmatirosa sp.]
MRLRFALLLTALLGASAAAQTSGPTPAGAVVSGVVHDSIAQGPLAGATVQLVAADTLTRFSVTGIADSLGRFSLAGVPDGHFMLGFFHPMLDSLGIESPLRAVHVDGGRPVRVDLAIPSPSRLRAAICGAGATSDSGGVVVGFVRGAQDDAPVAGVRVTGEWLELSFTPTGLVRRTPHLVATTGETGWFAICNVPTGGTMMLSAGHGADSTDLVEVQVPATGLLRRQLYVGPARTVAAPAGARHAGDGRVTGTVVAVAGGRPLAGAQVSLVGGPQTRASDDGAWTLAGAPFGTRMLEVRAVGYYPVRRPVDVVAEAAPVHVALSTLKAVLDTIKVAARRNGRVSNGFDERRRSGAGRYLTAADLSHRLPIVTSDLFRNQVGVRMEQDSLWMNSPFGRCMPAIFVDGHFFDGLDTGALDTMVSPNEIAGIEIYTKASVPAQFRMRSARVNAEDAECGSIVIWTK